MTFKTICNLSLFFRLTIVVHPVPDCLFERVHQGQLGTLLERPELGDGLGQQLRQPGQVNVDVLKNNNVNKTDYFQSKREVQILEQIMNADKHAENEKNL